MQRNFELKLRDMNEEISKRLDAFIKEQGTTRNSFALKINANSSNFSRKMNGKIKFTDKDFLKIHKLTGLSPTWLKTGEGEKYSGAGVEALGESNAITSKPFYDVDFALGFATMYNDTPNVPNKYVSVPGYGKADFNQTLTFAHSIVNSFSVGLVVFVMANEFVISFCHIQVNPDGISYSLTKTLCPRSFISMHQI